MTWDSSRSWPVRGKLARHFGRLQQHLDAVAEQVRQAVASAVGRTVADAVGEAIYDALAPYADLSGSAYRSYSRSAERSPRPHQARVDPVWTDAEDSSLWRDPYAYDHYDLPRSDEEDESEYRSSQGDESRARRWQRALAAGLQATAWWLRRHRGQVSLLAAVVVGSLVGLVVLASHVSAITRLVMSAIGLVYLLDLVRAAGDLLCL